MENVNKENCPGFKYMRDLKQNISKTGIIAGATALTYATIGGLEMMMPEGPIQDIVNLGQTVATVMVPMSLTEGFMKGENDYTALRLGLQAIVCGAGLYDIFEKTGDLFNTGIDYQNFLENMGTYIKIAGASIPFIKKSREILKTGYPEQNKNP